MAMTEVKDDPYTRLARSFAHKHDLTGVDVDEQWEVVQEEIRELEDAFNEWQAASAADQMFGGSNGPHALDDLTEEMADVLFTVHLLGEMLEINLRDRYIEKAKYNLQKSTERDENGKITDDAA